MTNFNPEDPDDEAFHSHFGGLRKAVVQAARGLADRVKGRVADVDRTPPRVSDVVMGGVAELFNSVARSLGQQDEDDDG